MFPCPTAAAGVIAGLALLSGARIDRDTREVEGWTVRVDKALLAGPDAELGRKALRTLGQKLVEIAEVVPADRVARLRRVVIVVDARHPLSSMQYHPSPGWLREHGYEPGLAKCVHVPRAADLAGRLPVDQQPMAVLHELAHAYHDQVLGFDDPRVTAAWERFKASGRYEAVLHVSGGRRKHYALTNPMEFFAEMTEAYFGTNDFYPFVRAELGQELPDVHRLLADVWGVTRGR